MPKSVKKAMTRNCVPAARKDRWWWCRVSKHVRHLTCFYFKALFSTSINPVPQKTIFFGGQDIYCLNSVKKVIKAEETTYESQKDKY